MKSEQDISLLLSAVRALLGNVSPALRAASVEWNNNTILWKCSFDESATPYDYELVSVAAAEIIADFPDAELEEIYECTAKAAAMHPLKNWIYRRHEAQ